jgi:hypothetical protein
MHYICFNKYFDVMRTFLQSGIPTSFWVSFAIIFVVLVAGIFLGVRSFKKPDL